MTKCVRVDIREAVPLGKLGEEVRDAVRVHQLAILVGGYVGGEFVAQHTAVGGLLRLPEFQKFKDRGRNGHIAVLPCF